MSGDGVEAVKLSYTEYARKEAGEDKVVLMVHDLMASRRGWARHCRQLAVAGERRVLAVDLRNHGTSPRSPEFSYAHMAADLSQLVELLGVQDACLVGHGLGGRAAMYLALSQPRLVNSLVVIDASPFGHSPGFWYLPKIYSILNAVDVTKATSIPSAHKIANKQLMGRIMNLSIRTYLVSQIVKTSPQKYGWSFNLEALLHTLDQYDEIPYNEGSTFSKPSLFLCGDMSDYVPKSDVERIKKIFTGSNVIYAEHSGHLLHWDRPLFLVDTISDFIIKLNKEVSKS